MAHKLGKAMKQKLVSIPIYYRFKENGDNIQIYILEEKEGASLVAKKDASVEVLNTKWKPNRWQTDNVLIQNSLSYNPQSGQSEVDGIKYQDNIIRECLAEWDLVDENNQPIPVSGESIDNLPPDIARAMIRAYNKLNSFDSEEVKK